MPTWSDPAPCDEDEQLYECPECNSRLCTTESEVVCDCGTQMRNISRPQAE